MDVKLPDLALLGRERELGVIEELPEQVGRRGGALVVRGEAGVGKTALLDAAGRMAHARGMPVLTTTGVKSEAHLSFAGLHQLLHPGLAALDGLPDDNELRCRRR